MKDAQENYKQQLALPEFEAPTEMMQE